MTDKEKLLLEAGKLVLKFSQTNEIAYPRMVADFKTNSGGIYGEFVMEKGIKLITIFMKACRPATKNPGWSWSYPGYKADVTPFGVCLHEFGHYIHYTDKSRFRGFPRGEKISSYEPDMAESIAETFKLFIGNPDLLKKIAPKRYAFLINKGFKPIIKKTWRQVLEGAHPKYFKAIENL